MVSYKISLLYNLARGKLLAVDQDLPNRMLEMLFLLFIFISSCSSVCIIHEQRDAGYVNVTDLGIAMHENDPQAVEDEVEIFGCNVNYDGASAIFKIHDYDNHYEDVYDYNSTLHDGNGTDNQSFFGGLSPLHIGCIDGSTEAIKKLMEYPEIEIDPKNEEGSTPLITAAMWRNFDIAMILCMAGADANTKNDYDHSPLEVAATYGEIETIKTLLQFGAHLDGLAGHHNETALSTAASNGHIDVVEYLADTGADLNIEDDFGRTALYWAIWFHHPDIADMLEGRGARL